MRAVVFESFAGPLVLRDVPEPVPPPGGVLVLVGASGVCRSDWHGFELTGGGAALSLDALGSAATCVGSVSCLRPRGRHVQVGLLPPALGRPEVPMDRVVALELELLGSHGMAAHDYPELLALVATGRLRPQELVTRLLPLEEAPEALDAIGGTPGISVISTF